MPSRPSMTFILLYDMSRFVRDTRGAMSSSLRICEIDRPGNNGVMRND